MIARANMTKTGTGAMTENVAMTDAGTVVDADLAHILEGAGDAFQELAGKRVLIVGGAGFLGYYLVQAALAWNRRKPAAQAVQVTVLDNYARGVPDWLIALEGSPGLTLVRHDITRPLPSGLPDFQYTVHGGSIASPTYYRRHPI